MSSGLEYTGEVAAAVAVAVPVAAPSAVAGVATAAAGVAGAATAAAGVAAIAAATAVVAAASTAVLGAGWVAWQGGKLLVELGRTADEVVSETKRQQEEEKRQRKTIALSAHNEFIKVCDQVLSSLDNALASGDINAEECKQMENELEQVKSQYVPDDTDELISMDSLGYLKIEKILKRCESIAAQKIVEKDIVKDITIGQMMEHLRASAAAVSYENQKGGEILAVDRDAVERSKLVKQLLSVTGRIICAVEYVKEVSERCGLSYSQLALCKSCFEGVDDHIKRLYSPDASNDDLKRGIEDLENMMRSYDMYYPTFVDIANKKLLYSVYAEAAAALGEEVMEIRDFKTNSEIEEKLRYLEERSKKAQKLAEIYVKLGPAAYVCLAWDTELKAMGYSVYERNKIIELVNKDPEYAKLGDKEVLPAYEWNQNELTNLYSLAKECGMQLIVHEDGTVSMQTFASSESNSDKIVKALQEKHCRQMNEIRKSLREKWFICYKIYNIEETKKADEVMNAEQWSKDKSNAWSSNSNSTRNRNRGKSSQQAQKNMQNIQKKGN